MRATPDGPGSPLRHRDRRAFLTLGGIGVAAALAPVAVPGRADAAPSDRGALPDSVRFLSEFGARGDGIDDTEAFRQALEWASEMGAPRALLLEPGLYAVTTLTIPPQVRLIGLGGGQSLYGSAGHFGGVTIAPVGGYARGPLVTLGGPATPGGAGLENIVIDGFNVAAGGDGMDAANWSDRVGLSVEGGFEADLSSVRVTRFRNTGIDVQSLNNARWEKVHVDLCGTTDRAAMVIGSPADGVSNFAVFDTLTIERSGNTALAIAAGDDPVRDWVSNMTFVGLHVEATMDTPGRSLNDGPLIDVGNVRAVTFVAPQLIGAPAPMLRYQQRIGSAATVPSKPGGDPRDQQGGVAVMGGQFRQHGGNDERVAAVLVTGNGRAFSAWGVKFASGITPGVWIEKSFMFDAAVIACTFRNSAGVPQVRDDREDEGVLAYWATTNHGNFAVTRDLAVARGLTVAGTAEIGTQLRVRKSSRGLTETTVAPVGPANVVAGWVDLGRRGPGTDALGRVYFRVVNTPTDVVFRVTFAEPFPNPPTVFLTGRSAESAALDLYVEVQDDSDAVRGFTVRSSADVQPSAVVHAVDYFVVGRSA